MSNLFYDTYVTIQGSNSQTNYNGTWSPVSSRSIGEYGYIGPTNPSYPAALYATTNNYFQLDTSQTGVLTYNFPSPTNISPIDTITFPGSSSNSSALPISITVTATNTNTSTPQIVGTTNAVLGTNTQDLMVPITNPGFLNNALSIAINVMVQGTGIAYIGPFSSTYTCVAYNSNILTPLGYKPVQDLQRGDEIVGGKIARIIKEELHPKQIVEAVLFPPSSLEKNVPDKETIVCSEHHLVYKGKRRIGKCFTNYPGVVMKRDRVENVLPVSEDGKYYFYDIQFDREGEYIVNGMISQSRSPYALASPLPKELYFEERNYKEERTSNTLCKEPPISYRYLTSEGQET